MSSHGQQKAKDIRLIKIEGISSLGDYFVVASASNTTQVKAIADEVEDEMTKLGLEPNRVEGRQSAQWILMDYYDVMVHVFWTRHATLQSGKTVERRAAAGHQRSADTKLN